MLFFVRVFKLTLVKIKLFHWNFTNIALLNKLLYDYRVPGYSFSTWVPMLPYPIPGYSSTRPRSTTSRHLMLVFAFFCHKNEGFVAYIVFCNNLSFL